MYGALRAASAPHYSGLDWPQRRFAIDRSIEEPNTTQHATDYRLDAMQPQQSVRRTARQMPASTYASRLAAASPINDRPLSARRRVVACCFAFVRSRQRACIARAISSREVYAMHTLSVALQALQWAGQTPDFTRQSARSTLRRLTGDHQLWHGCTMQRWWQQSASSIGRWLSRRCRRQLEHTQEGEPCSPALAPKHC